MEGGHTKLQNQFPMGMVKYSMVNFSESEGDEDEGIRRKGRQGKPSTGKEGKDKIRSLQLLGAIELKPSTLSQGDKCLMYVDAKINGKANQVMVDTDASHNFIKAEKAKRLGLKLDKGQGLMKTVNTKAKPVDGMARGVELHLAMYIKLGTDKKEVVGIAKKITGSTEDSPPICTVIKSSIGPMDKANLRRRKTRRKPTTLRKKALLGRREHSSCRSLVLTHGNIKSTNILLDKVGNVRVSDFGLSVFAPPTASLSRSNSYHAPEALAPRKITQKFDVYSFGVLLLELLTGKCPSLGDNVGSGTEYGGVVGLPR
ncbi:hypothetical protein CsSME_00037327 [Camellia sinensis var. sinensis]